MASAVTKVQPWDICSWWGPCIPVVHPPVQADGQGPSSELYFQGHTILEDYQEAGVYISGLHSGFLQLFLVFC